MAARELSWKATIDPAIAKAALRELVSNINTSNAQITASTDKQAKAAIAAANQEFKEIQAIHAAKVRMAAQESQEIQRIHAAKARQAESEAQRDLREIQQIHAQKVRMAQAEAAQIARVAQQAARQETAAQRQRLSAVASLDKQRMAAALVEFKKAERAAANLAAGIKPVGTNLQRVTDIMQAMRSTTASLEGPLGAVAGRMGAFSTLAGTMGGAGGPVALAVAGVIAMHAAVIVLTASFIAAVKSTAEFQGKMFDLSQQTGVSVETLSALEVAATTTGGNIESISASLGIFQKNLENAQDPTSTQAKLLKELGVETENTEEAFRQALAAIAKMPEGFKQTATALELFGRGGKQILAIAKESEGSIDNLITKLRQLGAIITTEDAKAADEFNDQLALLQFQIRGTTALLVQDAIPHILNALRETSRVLKENREAINAVASAVTLFVDASSRILVAHLRVLQLALDGVRNTWLGIKSLLAAGITGNISIVMEIFQAFKGQQATLATLGAASAGISGVSSLQGLKGGFSEPQARGGRGGGGAKDKASEGQRLLNQLTTEANRLQDELNKRTKLQIVLLDEKYLKATPGERALIEAKAREIETTEKSIASDKKKAEATDKIRALLERQTEAVNDARQGDDQWADEIVKLEAELKKLGLTMDANTKKLLTDNAATQKALSLTRERIALEETRIKLMERERVVTDEQRARQSGIDLSRGDEERPRSVVGAAKDTRSEIDKLFDHVNENLTGARQTAALAGLEAMSTAFDTLGQAVGQAAYAWVLYGNAGTNIRKITAEILASVAQQALVKSIFQLAEGFASLFLNPAEAAAHFHAAALYAAVGGVAAVVGRSVAGNEFTKGNSTAGSAFQSATGSRSGGSVGVGGSSAPFNLGSQRGAAQVHLTIRHEFNTPLLKNHITNIVVTDAGAGGPVRQAIVREIKRQE